jgi:hypothetical protein
MMGAIELLPRNIKHVLRYCFEICVDNGLAPVYHIGRSNVHGVAKVGE